MESDCGTRDHETNTLEHFVLQTLHQFPWSWVSALRRWLWHTSAPGQKPALGNEQLWLFLSTLTMGMSDLGSVVGSVPTALAALISPALQLLVSWSSFPAGTRTQTEMLDPPRSAVCTSRWILRGSLGQQSTSHLRMTKVGLKLPNLVNGSSLQFFDLGCPIPLYVLREDAREKGRRWWYLKH